MGPPLTPGPACSGLRDWSSSGWKILKIPAQKFREVWSTHLAAVYGVFPGNWFKVFSYVATRLDYSLQKYVG